MKYLICCDSFKGSLDAPGVCRAAADGILACSPDSEVVCLPLADGGEGSAEAVMSALGGECVTESVYDPFGNPAQGYIGLCPERSLAVIDTAAASGIGLTKKYPSFACGGIMNASTWGTGMQIRSAIERGYRNIIVGLGGSGTNDGGIGAAGALGMKFYGSDGAELDPRGGASLLSEVASVSDSGLFDGLRGVELTLIFDVAIPLTGERGCSVNFAPQKGASDAEVKLLDRSMASFAGVCARSLGRDLSAIDGAGAAGGLGFGLSLVGGKLKPGADFILDVCGFDAHASDADVIITGEGKCDFQTAEGKLPACVASRARRVSRAAVVCICGVSRPVDKFYEIGADAVFAIADGPMTAEESGERCAELVRKVSFNIAGFAGSLRRR